MSKLINNIVQIIYLAKNAKDQVKKGNLSNAKKLFKIMQNIEEQEIHLIKKESYSKELFKQSMIIYQHLKEFGFDKFNEKEETLDILTKIISLENLELKLISKQTEGLSKTILKQIDPYIRTLSNKITQLSFVETTLQSCQGTIKLKENPECSLFNPYMVIKYKEGKEYFSEIKSFHKSLKKISTSSNKFKQHNNSFNYQFGFDEDSYAKLKEQVDTPKELFFLVEKKLIIKWEAISELVNKFIKKDNDKIKLEKKYFDMHH